MKKFDLKDKKILTILDEDARTPLSHIAERVGLSKQVVDYRIKTLIQRGVITGFSAYCDLSKLGYSTYSVYLRLKNISEAREKEIINYLVNHSFTKWVVLCEGKYDLAFAISTKNIIDFNTKLEEIFSWIGANLESYETNIVFSIQNFYLKLIERKEYLFLKPARNEVVTEPPSIKLDELDIKILLELDKNARASLVDIAQKVKSSADIIRYRLKNLIAKKIITSFNTSINFKSLGYNWYQIIMDLNNMSEARKNKLLETLNQTTTLNYMVKCMGKWDFELHVYAGSNEELRMIMMKIRNELADILIFYDSMIIFQKYKSTSLPIGVANELISNADK